MELSSCPLSCRSRAFEGRWRGLGWGENGAVAGVALNSQVFFLPRAIMEALFKWRLNYTCKSGSDYAGFGELSLFPLEWCDSTGFCWCVSKNTVRDRELC